MAEKTQNRINDYNYVISKGMVNSKEYVTLDYTTTTTVSKRFV